MTPHAGHSDYTSTITSRATSEAVFSALTTTSGLSSWWAPATGSGYEGEQLRLTFGDPEPLVLAVHTARPARVVVWEVLACPFLPEWTATTITFDLGLTDTSGCQIFFRHHGLTPHLDCYDTCRQGWNHFLPSLRDYVETGVGEPLGSAADKARRAPLA